MLIEAGHTITIIDKSSEFGGMVEAVIPPDRQSVSLENEIAAIFKDVPKDRMILQLGTELTAGYNLNSVLSEPFDAVFIGMGLPKAVSAEIESTKCEGLWNALDFLTAAKHDKLDVKGKRVAVIGGGNTAMDCAAVAKWHGAKDVYVIYRRSFAEMPAWSGERDRVMNEGVHFIILTQPVGITAKDGKLVGIKVCPTRLGEPDSSGRRRPEPIKSSVYELDMDIVVEAIGQTSPKEITKVLAGVELKNGLIKTKENSFQTSREKVFAGGDLVRGASTVVRAVADGMAAAKEIDKFLRQ
jgi:NADPH-dependent glutamate synthase beta subunit-like oxidoreductase